MSRFVFSLDAALRLQRSRLLQEEARLARLLQHRNQLENAQNAALERCRETAREVSRAVASGCTGAELVALNTLQEAQGLSYAAFARELAALRKPILEQQAKYNATAQECEKLSQLREREHETWAREETRSEQRTADEFFLTRAAYRLHRRNPEF